MLTARCSRWQARAHRKLAANIYVALPARETACGCVSDTSDTRLFIPATKTYTYPDVVMTCGEEQRFQDDVLDTLLNPTLIVEVLSPSTEAYDPGEEIHFLHFDSVLCRIPVDRSRRSAG